MDDRKIVAFSGGCFSGKTTTIERVARSASNDGLRVKIVRENIRPLLKRPIDEVRADPNAYFRLQLKIITLKIVKEWFYRSMRFYWDLILIDRSLADSYFYLTSYVSYSKLSTTNKILFNMFEWFVGKAARLANRFVYDSVFEFTPLDQGIIIRRDDFFRPKRLNSEYEYTKISQWNREFDAKTVIFDLNDANQLQNVFRLLEVTFNV